MTTEYKYNTGNPIGSTDVRDGVDNLKSFDVLLNSTDDTYQDRLGNTVPTAAGAIKRLGPVVVGWTFTTGGTLNYPNEAALNPADGNYYSWTGEFPKVSAPGTDPVVAAGYVPRTDVVLRGELDRLSVYTVSELKNLTNVDVGKRVQWMGYYEQSDGGGNWGVVKSGPHVADGGAIFSISPTLYIEANLNGKRVNVRKFGARAVSDGPLYDCITQIRACEAYVRKDPDPNLQQTMYFPCGKYGISDTWHIDNALEFDVYCENIHFTSMATTAKGPMILCTDLVLSAIRGKVRFDNTTNPAFANFDTGLSVQAGTRGTNKNAFHNVTSMYFRAGVIVGDETNDLQCSENMFYNYNTFECPTAIDGGGSQTSATFIGGNIHGAPHANLPGAPIHALWVKGGSWSFDGAGVLTTQSASNQCIRMNPDKGAHPSYPQVRINGGVLETASPLLLINNPDGVALDRSVQPGQFSIQGTGGYCGDASVSNANFIDAADDFYGKIQVKNNNFYAVAARNAFNINAGPVAQIETDATSWGLNFHFRDWVGGINGGTLIHDDMLVAVAYNAASVTYGTTKQTIKFATKSSLAKYQRYGAYFNLATGLYTVPQGGHRSMKIDCSILGTGLNGDLFIEVGGALFEFGQIVGSSGKVSAVIEDLVGGTTVGVYLQLSSGSATLTNGRFNNINFTVSN